MKITKRLISLLLILITVVGMIAIPAAAASTTAFDILSSSSYAKTYTLATSGKTIPYTTKYLTTRGTASYGASASSYIDNAADELYILDVGCTNGTYWAYVSYPTSSGRVKAYIPLSAITGNNAGHTKTVSTGKFYCALRQNGSTSSSYYVAKGDTVYLVATSGSRYQILYPISGGKWRLAWCSASDYNKYCAGTTVSQNQIVSDSEIASAASAYGISTGSNAYKALQSINTKYGSSFTSAQKTGTLVFMFEGVGSNSSSTKRMNAMCVVVKNGKIVYINRNCSTIPDYPFDPAKNGGDPMPTIKSGIYSFTTVNHRGKYAALNVSNASVVRFNSQNSYYSSTSSAINVHRRDSNSIAAASASWVNSAGCLLVGASGTGSSSEYAKFIKALGIVSGSASATSTYSTYITGKIVIDRTYAYSYLSAVGYTDGAIKAIG